MTRAGYVAITLAVGLAHGRHDPAALLDSWRQWDTGWYLDISRRGYFDPATAVFFPLYPAAIAGIAAVLGEPSRLAAAVVLANGGALAAELPDQGQDQDDGRDPRQPGQEGQAGGRSPTAAPGHDH